jgi:hypothetical protein
MNYEKHIYWLSLEEASRLRETLETKGVRVKYPKGVVCTPLDEINKISIVGPEVWDETCARQGSWYRASKKNGLYLVVSSREIEGLGEKRPPPSNRLNSGRLVWPILKKSVPWQENRTF